MPNRTAVQSQLQQLARELASTARTRAAERAALQTNPMVPREGLPGVLRDHTAAVRAERSAVSAKMRQALTAYRDQAVLKAPPDLRPSSAAHASWIAAIAAQAPHYSPSVLCRTVRDAAKTGDMALVSCLTPLLESYHGYKKEFATSGEVVNALIDARAALDSVPEVQASNAAAEFCDSVEHEINALATLLSGDRSIEALDTHVGTGSFPTLLPPGTA
jgi:hypothetical protein